MDPSKLNTVRLIYTFFKLILVNKFVIYNCLLSFHRLVGVIYVAAEADEEVLCGCA